MGAWLRASFVADVMRIWAVMMGEKRGGEEKSGGEENGERGDQNTGCIH